MSRLAGSVSPPQAAITRLARMDALFMTLLMAVPPGFGFASCLVRYESRRERVPGRRVFFSTRLTNSYRALLEQAAGLRVTREGSWRESSGEVVELGRDVGGAAASQTKRRRG
jgi:hypothetical protein